MDASIEHDEDSVARLARASLEAGRRQELAGRTDAAEVAYEAGWRYGAAAGDLQVESESLRRLAVIRHHQHRHFDAISMAQQSLAAAVGARVPELCAEAMNAIAGIHIDRGELADARRVLGEALLPAAGLAPVLGKIEQNLGIVANIQGNLEAADEHFDRALAAFGAVGDDRGRAVVYCNLGLVAIERRLWAEAEGFLDKGLTLAAGANDLRLIGICHLNRAEVLLGQGRYEAAREAVDLARTFFHRIGSLAEEADAYHLSGRVYRATGRRDMAETMLKTAIELAQRSGAVRCEAESCRDLAEWIGEAGRVDDRDRYLARARALFARLTAPIPLAQVEARIAELEAA